MSGPTRPTCTSAATARIPGAASACSRASRTRPARRRGGLRRRHPDHRMPASWGNNEVTPADPVKNAQRIAEAVKIARTADAIVAVIGTNESTSREAYADNHLGDMATLDLIGSQQELVDQLVATGKPVVIVLMNGRPLSIPRSPRRCRRSSKSGMPARKAERRSRRRSSATSIPAASCRSACRAASDSCPSTTTEADVVPQLPVRVARAALPLRPRPELHDVHAGRPQARRTTIGPPAGRRRASA